MQNPTVGGSFGGLWLDVWKLRVGGTIGIRPGGGEMPGSLVQGWDGCSGVVRGRWSCGACTVQLWCGPDGDLAGTCCA